MQARLSLAIDGDDAGTFLAAVLQGIEAEIRHARGVGNS